MAGSEGGRRADEDQRPSGETLRQALRAPTPKQIAEGARIATILGERVAALLPPDRFALRVRGPLVCVDGVGEFKGNGFTSAAGAMWSLPLEPTEKLILIFESLAKGLQGFVSRVQGRPWPCASARAHVVVSQSAVRIWWGGDDERNAPMRMRPIRRTELEV